MKIPNAVDGRKLDNTISIRKMANKTNNASQHSTQKTRKRTQPITG